MPAGGRTCSGQALRTSATNSAPVTDAVERDSADSVDRDPVDSGSGGHEDPPDREAVADRIRERGERVRESELVTALDKLEACGEVSDADRRAVARLSTRLTAALVELWASNLADQRADPAVARELFEP